MRSVRRRTNVRLAHVEHCIGSVIASVLNNESAMEAMRWIPSGHAIIWWPLREHRSIGWSAVVMARSGVVRDDCDDVEQDDARNWLEEGAVAATRGRDAVVPYD
jgi:hypothetical protein